MSPVSSRRGRNHGNIIPTMFFKFQHFIENLNQNSCTWPQFMDSVPESAAQLDGALALAPFTTAGLQVLTGCLQKFTFLLPNTKVTQLPVVTLQTVFPISYSHQSSSLRRHSALTTAKQDCSLTSL